MKIYNIILIILLCLCLLNIGMTVAMRSDIIRGRLPQEQIRLYKGGNTYIIDQIEGLGRNKHFLSFKQVD